MFSLIKELWRLLGRPEESLDGKELDAVLAQLEEQYGKLAAGFRDQISALETKWSIAKCDLGEKPTFAELRARLESAKASVVAAQKAGFAITERPTVGAAPSKSKLANMFKGSPMYKVLTGEEYTPTPNAAKGLRFVEIGSRVLGRESDGASWRELNATQITEYKSQKTAGNVTLFTV